MIYHLPVRAPKSSCASCIACSPLAFLLCAPDPHVHQCPPLSQDTCLWEVYCSKTCGFRWMRSGNVFVNRVLALFCSLQRRELWSVSSQVLCLHLLILYGTSSSSVCSVSSRHFKTLAKLGFLDLAFFFLINPPPILSPLPGSLLSGGSPVEVLP